MLHEQLKTVFHLKDDELKLVMELQVDKNSENYWKNRSLRHFHLSMLCADWKYNGLKIKRNQLKKPVLNGKSIFDMLNEELINKNQILFAGSRLNFDCITSDNLIKKF